MYDLVVIGAGMAGMTIAARTQARGLRTCVLEAHGNVGGCAGYYAKRGFAFDVGATTLVDFGPDGVGGQLLDEVGYAADLEYLPGYRAWLPDRQVTLFRDTARWKTERTAVLGNTPQHQKFWRLLDQLADQFWAASRNGIRLPLRSPLDVLDNLRALKPESWVNARYLFWTMADALHMCGLRDDTALTKLLAMLLQDTVHASPQDAPLINSALGVTIRGAGLARARGGMCGFWRGLVARYRALGGNLRVGTRVERVTRTAEGFCAHTRRGVFHARQLVSTLPIWNSAKLGLDAVKSALRPYIKRDDNALGGAAVVMLGVPESEVEGQAFTHHQILVDYGAPLGDGNNMFVSVSSPGDTESAPDGFRAVMLSTHCELEDWEHLTEGEYAERKAAIGLRLIETARRVYPNLGDGARLMEIGTPRTYERYTGRFRGAVGGIRLNLRNSNLFAVPYDIGVKGFWQGGDTAWPGLGTVACVLASKHIADGVYAQAQKDAPWSRRLRWFRERREHASVV